MCNSPLRCNSSTLTGAVLLLRLAALSATETAAQSPERGNQPTSQKASSATLEILTRQTGLNFQTTRRQADVWRVREIQ